ncbi:MAG: hypothetical protein K0R56_426 [Sphingomonas sp.]|nr:hypothetical protein [Sphingomonas sp.]
MVQEGDVAVQKHARDILFFDLSVSRRAPQAPFPTLRELVVLWKKAQEDPDFAPKEFEKGAVTALIKDCEIDEPNEIATLLIEVSDKNAPNTTYLDHAKRTARHIKKEEPEGSGFSAHVVMSLRSRSDQVNTYLTLVEAIPVVSVSRIQATLNKIIRELCEGPKNSPFTYVRPGGTKKLVGYVPHILLAGYPSDRFLQDIEEGTINGLKLVAPTAHESLGAGQYLKMNELAVSVSVSRDIPKGERWETILTGAAAKKSEFPTARIYVQPEAGGKSFHVDVDVETGNIIGQAYVKSRRLSGFDQLLETSAVEQIVPHFMQRMKAVLIKERGDGTDAKAA